MSKAVLLLGVPLQTPVLRAQGHSGSLNPTNVLESEIG